MVAVVAMVLMWRDTNETDRNHEELEEAHRIHTRVKKEERRYTGNTRRNRKDSQRKNI